MYVCMYIYIYRERERDSMYLCQLLLLHCCCSALEVAQGIGPESATSFRNAQWLGWTALDTTDYLLPPTDFEAQPIAH